MDRLPPLNAVRAFEAAARRLSITLAAAELSVTPGAVSRQIKALEESLGVELFTRAHREIELTRQGKEFLRSVTQSLDLLRDATRKLKRRRQKRTLKVQAYHTFAMKWLIPRLSGFHAAHPEIEVQLTASLEPVDFRTSDVDGAIRLGEGRWEDVNTFRLMPNIIAPVVSRSLMEGRHKLRKPVDLRHHTLLHSIARPDDWAWWLDAVGVGDKVDGREGMFYETSAMAYAAAVEGHGAAIAQMVLVEADIREGRLITPFDRMVDMGDFTYYLLTPSHREEGASMRSFRSWLLEQFRPQAAEQGPDSASPSS